MRTDAALQGMSICITLLDLVIVVQRKLDNLMERNAKCCAQLALQILTNPQSREVLLSMIHHTPCVYDKL